MDLLELNRELVLTTLKATAYNVGPLSMIGVPCKLHIFSKTLDKREHVLVFGCDVVGFKFQLEQCLVSILKKTDRKIYLAHDALFHLFDRDGVNALNSSLWSILPGAGYWISGRDISDNTDFARQKLLPGEKVHVHSVLRFFTFRDG